MKRKMKFIYAGLAFCALFAGILASKSFAEKTLSGPLQSGLLIADFNSGDKPNNLGGDFGSWNKDATDDTQGSYMSFVADDALGSESGHSVRLDYRVDSPNPAYNGFWMKLNSVDFTSYDTLNFYIKGEPQAGFTKRLKLELKDASGIPQASFVMTGISDQWQKISIPFKEFGAATNWKEMTEFVVVFDDMNSRPKTGSIYLDNVSVSKA
ncbi:MAG: hypothetical protein A2Z83_04565 [Omnitrophica bacterium GWA2_52_8]|nr:MAG: hypothetical protein A2Z83_04565 [Omnitrophica bacterium GWA2_52_8]